MKEKEQTTTDNTDWAGGVDTRRNAVQAFLQMMVDEPGLKDECCDPTKTTAKTKFLEAGGYTNAPADVEVRCFYKLKAEQGDKLITLILPEGPIKPQTQDWRSVWVCTYVVYSDNAKPPQSDRKSNQK